MKRLISEDKKVNSDTLPMVLAIAQTESLMTYGVKHPDKSTIGIGGIKKFHKLSVNRDSLQAIEELYLRYLSKYKGNNKKALQAYKGAKKEHEEF